MENFKSLVDAVLENNNLNNGKWSDWEDAKHIQSVYGELENNELKLVCEMFLNALIKNEGHAIETCLEAVDILEYGIPFNRNNYK